MAFITPSDFRFHYFFIFFAADTPDAHFFAIFIDVIAFIIFSFFAACFDYFLRCRRLFSFRCQLSPRHAWCRHASAAMPRHAEYCRRARRAISCCRLFAASIFRWAAAVSTPAADSLALPFATPIDFDDYRHAISPFRQADTPFIDYCTPLIIFISFYFLAMPRFRHFRRFRHADAIWLDLMLSLIAIAISLPHFDILPLYFLTFSIDFQSLSPWHFHTFAADYITISPLLIFRHYFSWLFSLRATFRIFSYFLHFLPPMLSFFALRHAYGAAMPIAMIAPLSPMSFTLSLLALLMPLAYAIRHYSSAADAIISPFRLRCQIFISSPHCFHYHFHYADIFISSF